MTGLLAGVATAAALLLAARPDPVHRRLRLLQVVRPAASPAPGGNRRLLLLGAAGVAGIAGVGLPPWWPLVALVAVVAVVRHPRAPERVEAGELALFVELLGACLRAGAALPDAMSGAADAGAGLLRRAAADAAAELRAGAPPAVALRHWAADPQLAAVARTCARTGDSGAAAAAELTRLAARLRAARAAAVERRLARASVWVVLPLGLCFLPAFVLVGVVPLALGLLHHVTG